MKKFLLFSLLFITYLFAEQTAHKEVLLLHSYHKGYKWSDDISKAVENQLSKNKKINLTTVYMDTKKVSNEQYYIKLKALYLERFKNRKFDLIIASDNNSLEFLNNNREEFFTKTPVLFCGINNYSNSLVSNINKVSGVVEQVDLEKNFSLIKRIHPDLKKLYIINDNSNTGLEMKKNLDPIIHKYSEFFKIEYIGNTKMSDIKTKITNAEKDTVILFVLLHKDKTGNFFTYKDSLQSIKDISNIPIYGLWDFYINNGIVGGLLTSASAQGKAVSAMAIKILNGKDISEIPVLEKSPNLYIFDYNELNRFNIDVSSHVNDYIIINEPSSIYKDYTKYFIISIWIIMILSVIVVILRANIVRRKKVELALSNRLEFDKVLLDTIPNPIYYKNTDGKFLGCNLGFASLVNKNRNEIIGKTVFDFFPIEIATKNTGIDKELLETFSTSTSEFTFYTSSNHMKHIILNKAVYKNIDGSVGGIVCIMDDITERVQQKQFLIQQSKLAEMGDMVAAIAHQWNEPLVELSAQVQDIQTSYLLKELKDVEVKDFVKDSMVQIKYMSRTLSDFRNFLKPSTKKMLFSISKALNDINEIIGKQIFYSNVKMSFNYKNKNEELLIYGYENEFKQVLLNLINNAKNKIVERNKDTHNKGTLDINIERCMNYNTIEIIDDAGEIDEKIISSIFEPYFTTKENGTGIGLYMAKVIIEDKMRGTINVKNKDNHVIFTIKMPHNKV